MRYLRITPEQQEKVLAEITEKLKTSVFTSNIFSFSTTLADTKSKDKVSIIFEPKAYIKMRDLVDRYSSEVGWYGFIDKINDLEYRITDICVYSQLVTGATVKQCNDNWDRDMPVEMIKRRHFHGHSHVNMGVSPSGEDARHRSLQVENTKPDSFYFFMITNKSCAWSAALYDLAAGIVYDTDDIDLDVDLGGGEMLSDFVDESKKMIKTSTASALKQMMDERNGVKTSDLPPVVTTTNVYSGQSAWLPKPVADAKSGKEKKGKKGGKKYKGESIASQLGFTDFMTEDEIEKYAASEPGYFDDIWGHVSDTPSVVNSAVLSMMR